MAFDWSQCTVIHNRKSKCTVSDCFKGIYTYGYCLTPKIIAGLKVWLYGKMEYYGKHRFKQSDVEEDIAELLRGCCKTDRGALLMQRDVVDVESEIIMQIKRAIEVNRYRGLYEDNLPMETVEEYNARHIMTTKDVEDYLKGVPIFD